MILLPFLIQEIKKETIKYVDSYISDYQDQFHKISIIKQRVGNYFYSLPSG